MSGGFGIGFLKGSLVSFMGLSALSMVSPLAPLDPGKKSQVDLTTPAGSGFNAERTDTNPVLPNTDQSVALEGVQKPETGDAAPETPLTDTSPATQPGSQAGVEMPDVSPEEDDIALMTPPSDTAPVTAPPALGVPMPAIDNPVREIPVNQLPIVDPPATEVTAPPTLNEDGSQSDALATNETSEPPTAEPDDQGGIGKALKRNKKSFSNAQNKPLMSIILIDAGDKGLDREVLLTFSFPVTFALDASANGVTADAKMFSQGGFEVLALAPAGSEKLEAAENDADIDAAISAVFAKLPQAVGLVDGVGAELQQSPKLAKQVIASLQSTGHGLLTYDIGLNSTDQNAGRAGVFADTVFNVLDAQGENGATIKRYLDRAALEAGKDGHVIVIGHTYPETVTTLFSWALSPKSATVALAPVSASLLEK